MKELGACRHELGCGWEGAELVEVGEEEEGEGVVAPRTLRRQAVVGLGLPRWR